MSIDMIINNKLKSTCPVCKIQLSINSNEIQYCSNCRREYYSIEDDQQNKLEYDDIETVSEDNDGPVLLCEKTNEKESYESVLKRRFGSHVTVETTLYIPDQNES